MDQEFDVVRRTERFQDGVIVAVLACVTAAMSLVSTQDWCRANAMATTDAQATELSAKLPALSAKLPAPSPKTRPAIKAPFKAASQVRNRPAVVVRMPPAKVAQRPSTAQPRQVARVQKLGAAQQFASRSVPQPSCSQPPRFQHIPPLPTQSRPSEFVPVTHRPQVDWAHPGYGWTFAPPCPDPSIVWLPVESYGTCGSNVSTHRGHVFLTEW